MVWILYFRLPTGLLRLKFLYEFKKYSSRAKERRNMCLLVYIPKKDEKGVQLQRMVGNLLWEDSIEIFYQFNVFKSRLQNLTGNEGIALLYASTSQDLDDLVVHRNLFHNLRLVLILPDNDEGTIAQGHLLRPRFMSYQDNGFSDLAAVLQKMLKTSLPSPHSIHDGVFLNRGGGSPPPPSFPLRKEKSGKLH